MGAKGAIKKISGKQIKMLHIAKKQTGISDDEWADLIAGYNKKSSKDLNNREFNSILAHLEKCGFKRRESQKPREPKVVTSREAQLAGLKRLVLQMGRPWPEYINSLAQRICKIQRVEWLDQEQRGKLFYALKLQVERERKEAANANG